MYDPTVCFMGLLLMVRVLLPLMHFQFEKDNAKLLLFAGIKMNQFSLLHWSVFSVSL